MRLYRIGNHWVGTQREAQRMARFHNMHFHTVEVPTGKAGLIAFLNSRRHAPPTEPDAPASAEPAAASPLENATRSVEERALRAIEAYVEGKESVHLRPLQRHLHETHLIAVSAFWIAVRLQRLGWFKLIGPDRVVSYVSRDPRAPRDLAPAEATA